VKTEEGGRGVDRTLIYMNQFDKPPPLGTFLKQAHTLGRLTFNDIRTAIGLSSHTAGPIAVPTIPFMFRHGTKFLANCFDV
jgi:hypothetical protein